MADEESEQATRSEGGFDAWIAELRETEADHAPSLDVGERMARLEQLLERSLGANAALAERLSSLGEEVRSSRSYAPAPAHPGDGPAHPVVGAADLAQLLAALNHSAENIDTGLATVRSAVSTSQKGVAGRLDDLWLAVSQGFEQLAGQLEERIEQRLDALLPQIASLAAAAPPAAAPAAADAAAAAAGVAPSEFIGGPTAALAPANPDDEAIEAEAVELATRGRLSGELDDIRQRLIDQVRVELEVQAQDTRDAFSVLARHLTDIEARLAERDWAEQDGAPAADGRLQTEVGGPPAPPTGRPEGPQGPQGPGDDVVQSEDGSDAVVDFLATLEDRLVPLEALRELESRLATLERLEEGVFRMDAALGPEGPYATLLDAGRLRALDEIAAGLDRLGDAVGAIEARLAELAGQVASQDALTELAGQVAKGEAISELLGRVATAEDVTQLRDHVASQDALTELARRVATGDALGALTMRVATAEAVAALADQVATRGALEQLAARMASGQALAELTSQVATSEALAELAGRLAHSEELRAASHGEASEAQWQELRERLSLLDELAAGMQNLTASVGQATTETLERLTGSLARAEEISALAGKVATAEAVAAQSAELSRAATSLENLAAAVRANEDGNQAEQLLPALEQTVERAVEQVAALARDALGQDGAWDDRMAALAAELERTATGAAQRLQDQIGALRQAFESSASNGQDRSERLEAALGQVESQADQMQSMRDSVERLAGTVDALQARTSDLAAAADTGRLMSRLGDMARELSGSSDRLVDLDRRLAGLRADMADMAAMARESAQAAGTAGMAVATVASLERRLDAESETMARRLESLASAIEALVRSQRDDITGRAHADRLGTLRHVAAGISEAVRAERRRTPRTDFGEDPEPPRPLGSRQGDGGHEGPDH